MPNPELVLTLFCALLVLLAVLGLLWNAGRLDWLRPVPDKAREAIASIKRFCISSEVDNALRRMWPLWLLFAVCFGVVLLLNSMKAGLAIWGIAKVALAGPIGYLISYCTTARKHRPEALEDGIALGAALKSRDLIICATIVALAFGVP